MTAEFVTPRHPDKICDIISDSILDVCLEKDINSRVAVETMGGHGEIYISGEITLNGDIDIKNIVRGVLGDKYSDYKIYTNISKQSEYISNGVDDGGAGDQGIMIGYACNDNDSYLPNDYFYARDLAKYLFDKYPVDGKTQIVVDNDGKIENITSSFLDTSTIELENKIKKWKYYKEGVPIYANPAGEWFVGGLDADSGLTGRKIVVDNYGPRVPVGGGAFSGKDLSKVDRTGAYMARSLAVEYLKEYDADEVLVTLAYAIGKEQPVNAIFRINNDDKEYLIEGRDLSYRGIIKELGLYDIDFSEISKWGHYANKWIK